MVPGYERALAVFPTLIFIVTFLMMSAIYYSRYHTEESDEKAAQYYRDYIIIMNSQASLLSIVNGIILVAFYNSLTAGIILVLITQSLSVYVFVSLYMRSHFDSLFFFSFMILAYVFELVYFLFSGSQFVLLGRVYDGLATSLFSFVIIVVALSLILLFISAYSGRSSSKDTLM